MKVLFLLNIYPAPSHGSMRRDIEAAEAAGLAVERRTIRRFRGALAEAADRREQSRTPALLGRGLAGLVGAMVARPRRLWRAARLAFRVGMGSRRGVLRHLAYLAEACVLARDVESERIGHVHAHFTSSTTVAMLARELCGVSFSFTVHGPEEFDEADRAGLVEKLRRATFVRAISGYTAGRLRHLAPEGSAAEIRVIHLIAEPALLGAEPSPPPDGPRLIWVGRMVPRKGVGLLLEAVARLARDRPGVELVLAGDGPARPGLERAIRRSGLQANVRLAGWLDVPRLREEIRQARALVLPSLAEGMPAVLLESLAQGRPVIATAVAGIPELVDDGVNGWLIAPGSVDSLVGAMRQALRAPASEIRRMGLEGRRRVVEGFGPAQGAELAQLLRVHAAGSGGPGRRPARVEVLADGYQVGSHPVLGDIP